MQKKQLGQCFLNNTLSALNAVHALSLTNSENVLEIGGGGGFISQILVNEPFNQLHILELDELYYKQLRNSFGKLDKVIVEQGNILDYDLRLREITTVIGAIPYYITSPIIHKILRSADIIDKFVLIIQKEVSEKLMSEAKGDSSYWSLISFFYDKEIVEIIPAASFTPAPKVNSATIKFVKNPEKYKLYTDYFKTHEEFSKFSHRIFLNPRKMLHKTFEKDLLLKSNIDSSLRPHQLNVEQIFNLYTHLYGGNLYEHK